MHSTDLVADSDYAAGVFEQVRNPGFELDKFYNHKNFDLWQKMRHAYLKWTNRHITVLVIKSHQNPHTLDAIEKFLAKGNEIVD